MIAIVDDEEKEQLLIKKYIEEWASARKEPVEFQCFANSESFLFHWEDNKCYDLLLLDIEMGKMNGLDLARKIRTENEKLPIIFVTGYDEYMQYGYDVSALHYLIKPVNKDRLFQALDKWKQRSDKEDETVLVNAESVLIGNLLDNAMEACLQISNPKERFIRIYIDIVKKQLYISVTNSMQGRAKKNGMQFLSTKSGVHGFGLLRIDRIVAKYGGFLNRQNEEGVFATEVMLPI